MMVPFDENIAIYHKRTDDDITLLEVILLNDKTGEGCIVEGGDETPMYNFFIKIFNDFKNLTKLEFYILAHQHYGRLTIITEEQYNLIKQCVSDNDHN